MLLLALDTSSSTVAVAVCDVTDGEIEVRAESSETAPNSHVERLAPLIAAALREAGSSTGDLQGVVVGLGPAPFTGLRVGIVTARAMSDALGVPAYGVCSLDGIAHRFATGRLAPPDEFNSDRQGAVAILRKRGFEVSEPATAVRAAPVRAARAPRATRTPVARATAAREIVPAICPTCSMTLPATGICDDCG